MRPTTPAQRKAEIERLVNLGWTNGEISTELGVSHMLIEDHLIRIFAQHGLRNRRELRDLIQQIEMTKAGPRMDNPPDD